MNTTDETIETTEAAEYEAAQMALAANLECDPADLTEERYKLYDSLTIYSLGSKEYAIGTDSEADDAWEASLDSYLEECVYPELKEPLSRYFDEKAWKRDARYDGRGHSLSSYDGSEDEQQYDGEAYYIFRIN